MDSFATSPSEIAPGDLAALICLDDEMMQAQVVDQIAPLGFSTHTVSDAGQADFHLQAHTYELVVVHERFAGGDVESNTVLHLLRELPLNRRRGSLVVLVGPGMESHSEMQAFLYGVDLTLNESELEDFRTLAGRGLMRQEERYAAFQAVFKRVQERAG